MEKILITGTGRCGTTFLIKLFSWLEFDTGYNKHNYIDAISKNCNSGMERYHFEKYYILKNPRFMSNIKNIIEDKNIIIKNVIIPIRDYKLSAMSRVKHNTQNGGLWAAKDEATQIMFFNKIMANYVFFMTKYEINTTFIDFDKMVNDKLYLFNKLENILDEKNIDFELFCKAYDEVSVTSKP